MGIYKQIVQFCFRCVTLFNEAMVYKQIFMSVCFLLKTFHTKVGSLQRSQSVLNIADRWGARCAVAINTVCALYKRCVRFAIA